MLKNQLHLMFTDQKSQNHQNFASFGHSYAVQLQEKENDGNIQDEGEAHFTGRLQSSRRNILRYGSLGIAISCVFFTISNWKAMQYVSVKGVLGTFFADYKSAFGNNRGEPLPARLQQLKNYLYDLESRGTASIMPEFPSKCDWLNTAPLQFHRVV